MESVKQNLPCPGYFSEEKKIEFWKFLLENLPALS